MAKNTRKNDALEMFKNTSNLKPKAATTSIKETPTEKVTSTPTIEPTKETPEPDLVVNSTPQQDTMTTTNELMKSESASESFFTVDVKKKDVRNNRRNFVLSSRADENLRKFTKANGISANELINQFLERLYEL